MLRLPLFPLGIVLVPGMVLPLHVFEDRYRALVTDLLEAPAEHRRFGVVAIRAGREVGESGVVAVHDVGCTAHVRRVEPYDDGRFDLVTTGEERFALRHLHRDRPYLSADVEVLPELEGEGTGPLAAAVRSALADYVRVLSGAGAAEAVVPDLPTSPRPLSYVVAAATRIDLDERQRLLAEPDDAARLQTALSLLRREVRLLGRLHAVPGPELARARVEPN